MRARAGSVWGRAWARARREGAADAARGVLEAAGRRSSRGWQRLHARLVGTRLGPAEVARALGTTTADVAVRAADVWHALGARLPTGPHHGPVIKAALARHAPAVLDELIDTAETVCRHTFDLLGSGPTDLGPVIDWHRDFKSRHRWDPRTFYADVVLAPVRGADVKVPWELSRCQHLPVLAGAALLTGRERYAAEAVAQIEDWLNANPPRFGVNWACPMEVAIRAVNWLWTAGLLAHAGVVRPEFAVTFLGGLLAHGRHVMANLEVGIDGITSNHYLADVVGLLYLGLALPELEEATRWRRFAEAALADEMERQVLPDGADYESSIAYHRLVAEMLLSSALLCRHHGVALPPRFWARLARMIEFVAAYTKPNGLSPQVGDADDGRVHMLTGYRTADPRDHRHLLALGAMLFEREDWWAAAGPAWPEALWFGGAASDRWSRPSAVPPLPGVSAAFADAGIYIMREGDDYVIFTAGEVGTAGLGNHKHNDLLAVEIHLGGEDVVVDPGAYVYTSDPDARDGFRSTAAHATVVVDGVEQNTLPPGQLFRLPAEARPSVLAWKTGIAHDWICAEHDGYGRLDRPVIHRRTVGFERATGGVEIVDEFRSPAGDRALHELAWTFPFAPHCTVTPEPGGWRLQAGRTAVVLTRPAAPDGSPLAVRSEVDEGTVAPRYGVRCPAPRLRWRWTGGLPVAVRFRLERRP